MKSFLLKNNKPIVKWGMIPDGVFFEGRVPEGYALAISPSDNYIIVDVDKKNNKNGFKNIPIMVKLELLLTLNYSTKSGGKHYWLNYSGNKPLVNRSTKLGIDLRTNKGYVKWNMDNDIRKYQHKIKKSSYFLNKWLEKLFSYQ